MGIYDVIVFHKDFKLNNYYFNTSVDTDGNFRKWQTKDLFPSLDTYAILPSDYANTDIAQDQENNFMIFRRHPPEIKWTRVNEGLIIGEDEDIIKDADHWRSVRVNKNISISHLSHDGTMNIYNIHLKNGIVEGSELIETKRPVDIFFPEPEYEDILDLSKNIPQVKNTNYNIEELSEIVYENREFNKLIENNSERDIIMALNYYNTQYL